MKPRGIGALLPAVVLMSWGVMHVGLVAEPECLTPVTPAAGSRVPYQGRGDRCEGRFGEPVSGAVNFQLIGFHAGTPSDITDSALPVQVLGYRANANAMLRAVSTRPRLHYAMDTTALSPNGTYSWKTDAMSNAETALKPSEFALMACTNRCANDRTTEVWPVHLGQARGGEVSLALVLRASVPLKEVYLTMIKDGKTLRDRTALGKGYYPPNRRIVWPLNEMTDVQLTGTVNITVVAVSETDASDTVVARLNIPNLK